MDNLEINHLQHYINDLIPEYKDKSGVFLCTAGSAEIMINNQIFHIEKGTLYIISPLITIHRVSQSADFDGIHILDNLEVFYSVIHSIIDTILHLKLSTNPCLILSEENIQFVIARKMLIEAKKKEMEETDVTEERLLITKIIHLLEQETMLEVIRIYFRNKLVSPNPVEKKEAIVYNFIYSLHQNFKEQRSVTFYANEARLSVGYFTSVVKEETGRTPSDWIVDITIAQAKLMLEKTKKSIKEIASDLNFPEQFTFRKYFKLHTGLPPKDYRATHS